MRGVQARRDPRRIACFMAAAGQGNKVAQDGKTEQAQQSKVQCAEEFELGGHEGVPPGDVQEVLWKQFFADTAQWWDNRQSKPTSRHPDFRHKQSKVPLWVNNQHKPVWVDSQLATLDAKADLKTTSETTSSTVQGSGALAAREGLLAVRVCRKLCESGVLSDAVDALDQLVQRGCRVPSSLCYGALKRCIQNKDLALGRRIHNLTIKSGYEGDAFLATHLIGLYASHGRLDEAIGVFRKVLSPDAYNWAAIIFAYARYGQVDEATEAIRLYREMCASTTVKADDCLYLAVLKACAIAKDLVAGQEVHSHILTSTGKLRKSVQASVVNMYVKCGCLKDARRLFDKLPDRNVVTWTAMIAGYAQQGMGREALSLYSSMQQEGLSPNFVTFACLLQACATIGIGALHEGKQLHAHIDERGLEENALLGGSLVNMYAKCGSLEDARIVFNRLSERNLIAWTAMLAGYVQQGMGKEALSLYTSMRQERFAPDSVGYICLLQACASVGGEALQEGKQLHAQIDERGLGQDTVIGGSLVNMYAKCGSLEDARILFNKLPDRNVVAWTAMIAGYAQQGMGQEALVLYSSMQQEGLTPDSVTYVRLLQACANVGVCALCEGKQLHAQMLKQGLEEDAVLGGSLVNMYAKCGSLQDARGLFDKLSERNIVAWTAMISEYAQQGMGEEALNLYSSMRQQGLTLASATYVSLLQACASIGVCALDEGKQLHEKIREQRLEEDAVLESSLVNMYTKCGGLEDAQRLFNKLSCRSVVTWTAMIAGYVKEGMTQAAFNLYERMQKEGLDPDSVTFVCLLQACAKVGVSALHMGKQLHVQIEQRGLEGDSTLGASLVNMYAKCGGVSDAQRLFDRFPNRDLLAWTTMVAGYMQQGMGHEALRLYARMQHEGPTPDSVAYARLLQACASVGAEALRVGKKLHTEIGEQELEEDEALSGSLVSMYAKCGHLEDARRLFDRLRHKNVAAWTAVIAGYAQEGMGKEALGLYSSMQQEGLVLPNSVTYVCLLQACASVGVGALHEGKQLHEQIEEQGLEEDAVLGGCLVNMYAKCDNLEDARKVFDKLLNKNIVAWNAMIAGYAQQGMGDEALDLYRKMQQEIVPPDSVTYVSLLQACAGIGVGALHEGKKLHVQIEEQYLEKDVVLGGSLVNMYAKCGSLVDARKQFDLLADRSLVAWNAMIAGYVQQGLGQEALDLYNCMNQEGLTPDAVTYACLLQACAAMGALSLGKQLHTEIEEKGMQADGSLGAALVNMYAKCGTISDSQRIFDAMAEKNIAVWNALISGYARQGDSQVVFDLLLRMRVEGILPDAITFLYVLTVCSHAGLVAEGREHFEAMKMDYGIDANMEHYICMVDLLGRAGHLHEALQIAKNLPFQPNDVVWHTLLGACQKWKDVEIGQEAFKGAVSVDENNASAYVMMFNIYASAQMWDAAKEMKARRMEMGAWKKPGQSWCTDMGGVVHTFFAGNTKQLESDDIQPFEIQC